MLPAIRVVDVSKRFRLHHDKSLKERVVRFRQDSVEDFWALREVSFDLDPSTTLGFIGANGSGKTTLLKIIGGILTPTTGYVERRGRIAALLELGAGFHPDLTGRENVYLNASVLGLSRKQTNRHFDSIVEFSGIERFIDNQVKFYSSGMYVRLAFAVAVHVDPEILLVDEVLAVGDEPFQRKCIARIKQFQQEGRTILFVTHALDMVRELCDRVILLESGQMLADGKPAEALRTFRDRYAAEIQGAADERGTRAVEVLKVSITNGAGAPKDRFRPGEEFGLELEIEAHLPVDDPVIGVAIYNHLDMLVFGTNTALVGIKLGTIDGRRRVVFTLGQMAMVEGQYFVTAAVHSRDGQTEYHWLERQASFKVFDPTGQAGVLHMPTKVEVLEI